MNVSRPAHIPEHACVLLSPYTNGTWYARTPFVAINRPRANVGLAHILHAETQQSEDYMDEFN